ncbi:DNA polymerase III subunit delta [Spiroplasma endosymbiont of Panorpa germanica]|uniref:DNA polymerase III subunit delta n=1 Tax=Spiroplasma endosymbiont of Panorpa germanica TaxID=3066314 RepID=UPI0030CF12E4
MYLFLGNDDFLVRKEAEKAVHKLNSKGEFEVFKFDLINDDFNAIINEFYSFNLFAKQKIIIIEEAWFLTEKKVSLNKNFSWDKLKTYLDNPNPDNKIIFILKNDKISKKLKISKYFEEKFKVIMVPELSQITAKKLISNKLDNEKIEYEEGTLEFLLSKIPLESRVIINETNKLVNLGKRVTKSQISSILSEYFFYDIFEISNHFLNGDLINFLTNYRKYRSQNKEVFSFIILVTNTLILMRNIRLLKNNSLSNSEIAEKLSVNPYRISKILEINFRNFKQINDKIKEMYVLISNIFEGNFDDEVIPELFFIKTLLI